MASSAGCAAAKTHVFACFLEVRSERIPANPLQAPVLLPLPPGHCLPVSTDRPAPGIPNFQILRVMHASWNCYCSFHLHFWVWLSHQVRFWVNYFFHAWPFFYRASLESQGSRRSVLGGEPGLLSEQRPPCTGYRMRPLQGQHTALSRLQVHAPAGSS